MKVSKTIRVIDADSLHQFRSGITYEHYSYGEYDRSAGWLKVAAYVFAVAIVVLLGALWQR